MTRTYTIIVMGGPGVGKSALTIRFFQDKFVSEYDPTIEENYRKQYEIDHEVAMLDVMDTAGAEEYEQIRNAYIVKGEGFLLVYSITDLSSFQQLKGYSEQIMAIKGATQIPLVVVGNKSDLEEDRKVDEDDAQRFATTVNAAFYESSAKEGTNTTEPFYEIVRAIRRYVPAVEEEKKKKKLCFIL